MTADLNSFKRCHLFQSWLGFVIVTYIFKQPNEKHLNRLLALIEIWDFMIGAVQATSEIWTTADLLTNIIKENNSPIEKTSMVVLLVS